MKRKLINSLLLLLNLLLDPLFWLFDSLTRPTGDWRNNTLPPDVFVSPLDHAIFKMENARKYGTLADYWECEKLAIAEAEKVIPQ